MKQLNSTKNFRLNTMFSIFICLCIMVSLLTGCVILLPDQREEPTEVYYITSPVQNDQSYL